MKALRFVQIMFILIGLFFLTNAIIKFNVAGQEAVKELEECNKETEKYLNKQISELPDCEYHSYYSTHHLIGKSAVNNLIGAFMAFGFAGVIGLSSKNDK